MRRDCKNVFILTLLICFISVGYSFLETNLAISGVVDVSKYNPPTFTVSDIVNKSNPPGKNYQTSTDSEKGEMYGFYHPTTLQTPTLTDYRYIGGIPNNYIRFNNETWRIIGVFSGRIKIIRDSSIGSRKYDDNGSEWATSLLAAELNGIYFQGMSDDKKYIDSVTYYLGGREWDAVTHYGSSIDMYAWERGKTVYSNRSINWTGYVGLMYPSDYAYTFANGVNGTDTTCFDDPRYCGEHNPSASWLYKKKSQWTISHESGHSDYIFNVNSEGNINGSFSVISNVAEVRPVVYLNSSIMLSGTGTINDPYVIVRFL